MLSIPLCYLNIYIVNQYIPDGDSASNQVLKTNTMISINVENIQYIHHTGTRPLCTDSNIFIFKYQMNTY
jgi:hypothetical protein